MENDFKSFQKNGIEYTKVCSSDDIFEGKGRKVQFPGDHDRQVAIFRLGGTLYAVENICPHRHADRLHEGIIRGKNLSCPLHGWTYSVETGLNVNAHQGLKNLKIYDVYEENGEVFVEVPELYIPKWRRLD